MGRVDHRLWLRKSWFCRQNVECSLSASYRVSRLRRKHLRDLLERVAREAAPGEPAQESGGHGLPCELPLQATALRLERVHRTAGRLSGNLSAQQVGANSNVAVATPEPSVVVQVSELPN